MAHGVHVVLQVTLPIIGQDDAAQFAITSEVETSIGGKHQQASHVPPTDLLLGRQREFPHEYFTRLQQTLVKKSLNNRTSKNNFIPHRQQPA